jgi:hypothetical protein
MYFLRKCGQITKERIELISSIFFNIWFSYFKKVIGGNYEAGEDT